MENQTVSKDSLFRILDLLDELDIHYWVDGGWGVDILSGKQNREHRDVDIDFDGSYTNTLLKKLNDTGYTVTTDWSPARIELHHPELGYVDIHPLVIAPDGSAKQADLNGGYYEFRPEWFSGAVFERRRIPCISAAGQKIFHSGYELRDVDKADLEILHTLL